MMTNQKRGLSLEIRVAVMAVCTGVAAFLATQGGVAAQDGPPQPGPKMVFQKGGAIPPGKDAKAFEVATIKAEYVG